MSNSPGLVDFAVRLVDFILHLPNGQVKFWVNFWEEIYLIHCTNKNFFQASENDFQAGKAGKSNFLVP